MATTDNTAGLFATPEQYQQAQLAQQQANAMAMAQLTPEQQANAGMRLAGYQLGQGIAGAMGAKDPMLQIQSARQSILKGVDQTSATSLRDAAQKLADMGDLQGANALAQQSVAIQSKIDEKQMAREAQLEAVRMRNEAMIQAARERGATQLQIAQMQIESRNQLAQMAAALKGSQPKMLPPSLQKDEGKDLETIDTYTGQANALKPALDALTPNEKGVRKLELGPLKNMKYEAQLAAGNSTPEALAYEGLKSAVDTAVNLQVSAEKGVQTDKDVLRFAKALVASYGRNDTEATMQALKRYQESIIAAQDRAKARVESRRKSQGVEPYYINDASQQPKRIKLD
jgi:hypothetical protein